MRSFALAIERLLGGKGRRVFAQGPADDYPEGAFILQWLPNGIPPEMMRSHALVEVANAAFEAPHNLKSLLESKNVLARLSQEYDPIALARRALYPKHPLHDFFDGYVEPIS